MHGFPFSNRSFLEMIVLKCFYSFFVILGTGRYGYSFVRITALLLSSDRLWVGTGNGVILSVPLVAARPTRASSSSGGAANEGSPSHPVAAHNHYNGFMPYCSMVCIYDFDLSIL